MLPPSISTLFPYTTLFRSGTDNSIAVSRISPKSLNISRSANAAGYSSLRAFSSLDKYPAAFALRLMFKDFGLILRSEEHTSELQSLTNLVCRLLLEKKKKQ